MSFALFYANRSSCCANVVQATHIITLNSLYISHLTNYKVLPTGVPIKELKRACRDFSDTLSFCYLLKLLRTKAAIYGNFFYLCSVE